MRIKNDHLEAECFRRHEQASEGIPVGDPCEARRSRRGGRKELLEKLGRNDPCPCGSGSRFQAVLPVDR